MVRLRQPVFQATHAFFEALSGDQDRSQGEAMQAGGNGEEVLSSGHSQEEIREDVEDREEFLSHLDQEMQKAGKKAKLHFREALEADRRGEKLRHYRKAKGYKTYRDGFQQISDQVATGQQALAVMDIEATKETLAQQVENLGFNIDLSELQVDDVSSSIEDNSFDNNERRKVLDQLQRSQEVIDDPEPPYQDLMEEGEAVEAGQIQEEVDELSASTGDSQLDKQIRSELDEL